MDQGLIILFFVGVAVLVIVLGVVGWLQEKRRAEAFQALAQRLGLHYRKRDRQLPMQYGFLDKLAQGSNRYAFNILEGEYGGHPMRVFDYHYETYSTDSKGRRTTHHHYFSFFMLEQAQAFPELTIAPETFLSKVGQFIGFEDIDFESIEFSKAFVVRSRDKKFAYDICHTRMMEYLLANRELSLEIEGHCVGLFFNKRLDPNEIEPRLQQLCEIRALFPDYLYRA